MKVNLKKMGAIVAGATMLASSAAFAGLMFGSTTLVDDNGAPVAKVVVGSNAHPSDGVAAALIAGKIVSETYKSQTLTAQVSGTASCTPTGAGNATGTCSISNEKARLEITVPGAVAAGTWTGENLIGDFLNRELMDREENLAGDSDAEYELSSSDTSENANPFTDGSGGSIGPSETFMYRVDGGQFSVFADRTLTDEDAGNTYVEMQDLWLAGDNHFDEDPDEVVGKLTFLAYTLKFDGPGSDEIGVPVCTEAEDQDYSDCEDGTGDSNEDDATASHRLKVWFLGEQWIISDMEAPTDSDLTNENELRAGGMVKLAKEAVAGILNQGESLPVDNLKFQLDDLEAHGDTTSAILSVLDANGNILLKDKVDPGDTKEMTVQGKVYRFHVYKVAPGYTFGAKWADVAIFAQELELVDGQELDQDEGMNEGYEVALGWKNLDAATGAPVPDGGDPEKPDALRTIVIFSDDIEDISSSGEEELEEGDYVSIVQEPEVWKLSYLGLDLTSDDRSNLQFELKSSDKTLSGDDGADADLDGDQDACTIFAPYIEVSSGDTGSVFEIDGDAGLPDGSDDEFLVALNQGDTTTTPGAFAGAALCDDSGGDDDVIDAGDIAYDMGALFMRISSSSDVYTANDYDSPGMEVRYDDIGDGDNGFSPPEGGAILFQQNFDGIGDVAAGDDLLGDLGISDGAAGAPLVGDLLIGIAEKAGTGSSNEFVDYFVFGVDGVDSGTPSDATFDYDSTDGGTFVWTSDDEEILYGHATPNPAGAAADEYYAPVSPDPISGPVEQGTEIAEEGYISERGSVFSLIDDNTVEFDMAHKLARAQWFLSPSATSAEDASKTIVTLGEGESTTVSGVTVKVLEITETVGACSAAGGGVACTADMSGVSAVIMPNNAASVNVAMPYTGNYGNVVILDTDAVGVNTLVSVGGNVVNSVTADLLQGSAVDWTVETKVVREVVQGSKIVVAGREKEDTLAAAQDFVAQVQKV